MDLAQLTAIGATAAFVACVGYSRFRKQRWRRAIGNGVAGFLGLVLGLLIVPTAIMRYGPIAAVLMFAAGLATVLAVLWKSTKQSPTR
jgi:ABC-type Co2+ transport system permease subunit